MLTFKGYSLTIYFPVAQTINEGDTVFLGNVGANHTILIITDSGPVADPYRNVESTCKIEKEVCSDRCWIYIRAEKAKGEHSCRVRLYGNQSSTTFYVTYVVGDSLVLGLTSEEPPEMSAGKLGEVEVYLANLSAGYTRVRIGCEECGWTTLELEPNWNGRVRIPVTERIPGTHILTLLAQDTRSGEEERVKARVIVRETLENVLSAPNWAILATDPIMLIQRAIWGVFFWS